MAITEDFMKHLVSILVMVSTLWTPLFAQAKNDCACEAIPDSKTYQGPARVKKLIGYTINWSCDFHCRTRMNDPEAPVTRVRAYYHDYFVGEDGDEGICEGMVYRSVYNMAVGREVYTPTDQIKGIVPSYSASPQIRQWGKANDCR